MIEYEQFLAVFLWEVGNTVFIFYYLYIPYPSKVPLSNWAVFYAQRCAAEAEELANVFIKLSGPMGVKVGRPRLVPMKNDFTNTYCKSIHAQVTSEVCQTKTTSVIFFTGWNCLKTWPHAGSILFVYSVRVLREIQNVCWIPHPIVLHPACLHEFPDPCLRTLLDTCTLYPEWSHVKWFAVLQIKKKNWHWSTSCKSMCFFFRLPECSLICSWWCALLLATETISTVPSKSSAACRIPSRPRSVALIMCCPLSSFSHLFC